MKWEITITSRHPGATSDIMHRVVDATARGDIEFSIVKLVEEEK